jgi:hypothetical protein
MKAALSAADRELDFAGAIELDEASARKIPADMIAGCSTMTTSASC